MKTLMGALAMWGVLLGSAPAQGQKPESGEAFVQRWVAALNKSEANALLGFYDRSEELEVLVSGGTSFRGYKKVAEAYKEDFAILTFYDSKAKNLRVRTLGEFAFASFEHLFKFKDTNDRKRRVHIRTTMGLRRVDGAWRIVQEHSSPIRGIERWVEIE